MLRTSLIALACIVGSLTSPRAFSQSVQTPAGCPVSGCTISGTLNLTGAGDALLVTNNATIGSGTGQPHIIVNGGNTNAADGPRMDLQWAGTTRGGLFGYSAFFGGGIDTRTLLSGFDGLVFASNNVVAGTVSAAQNWTLTGSVTPTGGLAPAGGFAVSPRNIGTCGTAPNSATSAYTAQTPVATEFYVSEVFVPANVTVTGVAVFNSATISGNVKVGLANSSGVNVATSASTAMAGTSVYQRVPFTGTYAAVGPATYYVEVFYDNATVRPNTITAGSCGVTKATSQVFATGFTTVAAPTTFTTALGPVANLY